MSNKLIVAALLLAMGSSAWAETSPTFAEIAEIDAKVKKQELLNKLSEVLAKSHPAGAAPSLSAPVPALPAPLPPSGARAAGAPILPGAPDVDLAADVRVMAVYGVGDNLFAEVQAAGVATTVSVRGNRKIGPWTVTALTPYEMTLSRGEATPAKGKKKATAPVTKVISIADNSITPPGTAAPQAAIEPEDIAAKAKAASKLYPTSMPELPIPMPPRAKE